MRQLSYFFFAQSNSSRRRRLGSMNKEGNLGPVGLIKVPSNCQNEGKLYQMYAQSLGQEAPSKSPRSFLNFVLMPDFAHLWSLG